MQSDTSVIKLTLTLSYAYWDSQWGRSLHLASLQTMILGLAWCAMCARLANQGEALECRLSDESPLWRDPCEVPAWMNLAWCCHASTELSFSVAPSSRSSSTFASRHWLSWLAWAGQSRISLTSTWAATHHWSSSCSLQSLRLHECLHPASYCGT